MSKVEVRAMKDMFRDAFDRLGGVDFLVEFAQASDSNARVFVQAVAKLIPQELTGKDGAPITIVIRREGVEDRSGTFVEGQFTHIQEPVETLQ